MAGTTELLHMIGADWRRVVYYLIGGWAMFAVIAVIALYDLGCKDCPELAVDRFVGLKLLLLLLFYAMAPWVIFTLGVTHNTALRFVLPLSRRQINESMLLNGITVFLCCLPAWLLLAWLLPRHGIQLHGWMFVFTGLALIAYQMYSMRVNVFWRALVPAIFPLLIFPPHSHETFRRPLEMVTTPWPSLVMIILILLWMPSVLAARVRLQDRCPR